MAFGNRSDANAGRRHRPRPSEHVEETSEEPDVDARNGVLRAGLAVVTLLGAVVAFVMVTPVGTASRLPTYETVDMLGERTGDLLSAELREDALGRFDIDYGRILTDPKEEPKVVRKAARACLPNGNAVGRVFPGKATLNAHGAATKMLTCLLRTDRERLCDADARARLAERLKVYELRHKNALGVQIFRDAATDAAGERPLRSRGVTEALDPYLAAAMQGAVRDGLLSSSDFSPFGLWVPRLYKDVLTGTPLQRRVCP